MNEKEQRELYIKIALASLAGSGAAYLATRKLPKVEVIRKVIDYTAEARAATASASAAKKVADEAEFINDSAIAAANYARKNKLNFK